MKSKLIFSLFVAALFLMGGCSIAPPSNTATVVPTVAAPRPNLSSPTIVPQGAPFVPSDFDPQRAFEHNRVLAVDVGTRVAGSDNGSRAGDYIAQEFTRAGFQVERQEFTFEAWRDRGTSVQVVSPEPRQLQALAIQYSPAGVIEGEIVPVRGNGVESDFAAADARGRIALVIRGTIPFSDKAMNAARAGAIALIIYNNAPGGFTGTLRNRVNIPTIAISGNDARQLFDFLSRGIVKVKISSDTAIEQKSGHNIIGTMPGETQEKIILGGHYDSVQAGPGANDNGSGTAVLLELARALAQEKHKSTLVIIGFDGEEFGLFGSRYYVEQLAREERSRIRGMLNFDMLGAGSGPLLAGGDGTLGAMARDIAGRLGITARNFALGSGAGSDHEPFQAAGIDTLFFSRDYDLLHTPQDTLDQVRPEYLGEAGRVGLRVVREFDRNNAKQ